MSKSLPLRSSNRRAGSRSAATEVIVVGPRLRLVRSTCRGRPPRSSTPRANPVLGRLHRAVVRVASIAFALLAAEGVRAQGVVVHSNLVYASVPVAGGTKDLRLDLYEPTAAPAPRPLVLWIHGGGWQAGTEDNPAAKFLADSGYVVASVQYRLSQEAIWPAQIHDVKGAVRWLRANAATYGIDVDRFGAWGSSAGGHLTAFLATGGDVGIVRLGGTTIDLEGATGGNLGFSSRVQAAVDWFGPTDFLAMDGFPSNIDHDAANSPESKLLGADIDTVPMLAASVDPRTFVTADDPPLLIQHGTADPVVPFSQSERLFEIGSSGFALDWRFVPVPDGAHGGPGFDSNLAKAFFDEHLAAPVGVEVSVATLAGAFEGGSSGAFRITRSGPTTHPLDVPISTAGDADEGSDYSAIGSAVRIPTGAAHVDVAFAAIDDPLVEGEETVELRIRAGQGTTVRAGAGRAVAKIGDDESAAGLAQVSVTANDPVGAEGAANPARFTFTRSGPTTGALSIAVRWTGRARHGVDYAPLPAEVVFPAGASGVERVVAVVDDARIEIAESVVVELLPGPNYALGAARSADARIEDNDAGSLPQVTIAVEDERLEESDGLGNAFLLSRTGATTAPLTVSIGLSGDAQLGADYAPFSNQVTFPPGAAHQRVRVDPVNDAASEGDEDLIVTVLPNAGYRVGLVDKALVRIADDDTTIPGAAAVVFESGAIRAGEPWPLTVLAPAAGSFVLLVAPSRGYAAAPQGYPLLLDAGVTVVLGPFATDPGGAGTLAFPAPLPLPDLGPSRIYLQAAVATPSSFLLSGLVERRPLPDGP